MNTETDTNQLTEQVDSLKQELRHLRRELRRLSQKIEEMQSPTMIYYVGDSVAHHMLGSDCKKCR